MWNTLVDIQTMHLRFSEPDYLNFSNPNEWVGITLGWVGRRYSMNFIYPGDITLPLVRRNTIPPHSSAFGTASYPGGLRNNTINLLLNTNITRMNDSTTRGRGMVAGASDAYSLDMTYHLCPPEGCNYVPKGQSGGPVLWSKAFTSLDAGQDLTLGPTQYILLDVSPPPLGVLTVQGRLEFYNGTEITNITLTVKSIVVFGSLAIGSPQFPYTANATIVLTGSAIDEDIIVDDKQVLGHKAIINFGNMTMYGANTFAKSWTRLATTASAGSSQLTLADNPGWKVGSTIVISMTEYSTPTQNNSQVS
jgi:G8 domain